LKLVTFVNANGEMRAGWLARGAESGEPFAGVFDMNLETGGRLPSDMLTFIRRYDEYAAVIEAERLTEAPPTYRLEEVTLKAPLPNPSSVRDFVAFETHVKNATMRSGTTVAPEWYEIPIFYFSNHHAIVGPDEKVKRPQKSRRLDYELEIACVIGREGRNIKAEEAEQYIFGYTIFNDWSARDLQFQEMKVNLGPAKGKDFATSIGPWLVTKDELEPYRTGDKFDLRMTAKVNGRLLTDGNFKEIYYSFAQMIERASADVTLYPGDILGSGTVGYGCILELGEEVHRWLEPGDVVELEVTGLGRLRNEVV